MAREEARGVAISSNVDQCLRIALLGEIPILIVVHHLTARPRELEEGPVGTYLEGHRISSVLLSKEPFEGVAVAEEVY